MTAPVTQREAKIARARELREQGLSYAAIASELGVSKTTPQHWLKPEWSRAHRRRSNAKRGAAKQAWAHEHDRPNCPRCGAAMSVGAHRKDCKLCRDCWDADRRAAHIARRARIAALWNTGATLREIATALDSTPTSVGVELFHMRQDGWDVPHHYPANRAKAAA